MKVARLKTGDGIRARELFSLMCEVFEEKGEPLSDAYANRLLSREDFWALAAFEGNEIVGGLTAHVLPMTQSESSELLIYDIAVSKEHQRKGAGQALMAELRALAALSGIKVWFVAADNEDHHALDFYRKIGGTPSPVTFFTFKKHANET